MLVYGFGARGSLSDFVGLFAKAQIEAKFFEVMVGESLLRCDELPTWLGGQDQFKWVVFTSPRAVEAVGTAFPEFMRNGKLAAVGNTTAAAIRKFGGEAAFVAEEKTGSGLGNELPIEISDAVLLLRGERANPDLPKTLTQKGAIVTDVAVYKMVALPLNAAESERKPEWMCISSSAIFERIQSSIGVNWLQSARICAIGPTTSATIRAAGLECIEAAEPSAQGFVEAIVTESNKFARSTCTLS